MSTESIPVVVRIDPLPWWKRVLDIACCLAALPFLAVASLWALLITTIVSPGPIFFRQERVGLRGRRFHLYKFRTMHVKAPDGTHQEHFVQLMKSNAPMEKLDAKGDRRLILGGWLLRSSGLDELPQVINVLLGDMSIVGPRPCIPYECAQYTDEQRKRLASVPGLTGLWQVSGKNRTTFEEMIRLDIEYGTRKSFLFDLGIILRTVPALCQQVADTRRARKEKASVPAVPPVVASLSNAPAAPAMYVSRNGEVSSAGADAPPAAPQFTTTFSVARLTPPPGPGRP